VKASPMVEAPLGTPASCHLTPFLGPQSQFHALDSETDTTLVLLAAPPHMSKLHSIALCAVHRDSSLHESTDMANIRVAFAELSGRRRASRSSSFAGLIVVPGWITLEQ